MACDQLHSNINSVSETVSGPSPFMRADQMFVEKAAEKGHSLLVAQAHKFTEKLWTTLSLKHPDPSCYSLKSSEIVIQGTKKKTHVMKAAIISYQRDIKTEKWHGHLPSSRRQDVCTYSRHCWCNGALRAPNTDQSVYFIKDRKHPGGGGRGGNR